MNYGGQNVVDRNIFSKLQTAFVLATKILD
ncbi:hypothetical protein FHS77_002823 [Paenochrobactrum gallinarii]|uniref:Uncharacterized protein n=1 Tax=Paenochrobactrum gallinarii TaxID=643673 RepID=A0A841M7M3_9HYPH|nr:hypothetical protein [Paenochrobactrum gallinarii]